MMTQARRQTVFPAPRYDDAWGAIAFLERCFGFERQTVHEGTNGTVAHGELRLGTASFGLTSASGHHLWCFGTYNHAPLGEPALFLVLRYADGPAAARWLAHAFGFEPAVARTVSSRSEPTELRLGDSAVWLSAALPDDRIWGTDWHATHVVVPDVDAHCDRASRSGAPIVQLPTDTADGSRVYWARDAEGYLWTFGTQQPGSPR